MRDLTHDPAACSWVTSAQDLDTDFPLQNLPLGIVRGHAAVAIGDHALDLQTALEAGLLADLAPPLQAALRQTRLNAVFALGRNAVSALRHACFALLREDSPLAAVTSGCLVPLAGAPVDLPCEIGDYTDFFASLNHARNTFNLFRRGQDFLPNYKHLPIAYHGRSSSIGISPQNIQRPLGQARPAGEAPPEFGPSRKLDFEVELGFWVGAGNTQGQPIPVDRSEDHLTGVCLLNDWSARDVQAWESQPLGPFLSKNFASTISPWVVTLDALVPFRADRAPREADDPTPLPYLAQHRQAASFDIHIQTTLHTAAMRAAGHAPAVVTRACFARDTWWTPAQMVAHHTIGGCNLRPGDLIGSGTISGALPGSAGSLLELTEGGLHPLELPGGEQRSFLHDGDEVTLQAWCERPGARRIGLGRCTGRVLAARSWRVEEGARA